MPSDFSEFDSLTTEVNFFSIPNLSQCLEKIKQEKLKLRYIEILETKYSEAEGFKIFLTGKKEDLEVLPLNFEAINKYKWKNAENSSYFEIISYDKNARFLLAEHLSGDGWKCKTSGFCSSSCGSGGFTEYTYRDLWEK